jgi:hypothetical protein
MYKTILAAATGIALVVTACISPSQPNNLCNSEGQRALIDETAIEYVVPEESTAATIAELYIPKKSPGLYSTTIPTLERLNDDIKPLETIAAGTKICVPIERK